MGEEKPEEGRQGRPRAATADAAASEPGSNPAAGNTKPRQLMKKLFQR